MYNVTRRALLRTNHNFLDIQNWKEALTKCYRNGIKSGNASYEHSGLHEGYASSSLLEIMPKTVLSIKLIENGLVYFDQYTDDNIVQSHLLDLTD